jgi:CPA2 family monovalent cation:H+ antiporter-2
LKNIFRQVALGGLLQVGVTTLVTSLVCLSMNLSIPEAIVYGFVFALSSTALVLRTLGERGELDAPHGRFIVGTLIFQDLCIVPMVLIVPLLINGLDKPETWQAIMLALVKAALVVVLLFAISRKVIPLLFRWVNASRSNEVFILTVLCLCIGTAYLTSLTGLSLALGAFLAGMIVADTDFRHRAMGDILPLRDVFVSFFFVSLGMFFDFQLLAEKPVEVGLLLLAFIGGKGLIAILAASFMRFPPRAAWLAGVGLAQFGEFGFIILQLAIQEGVVIENEIGTLLNAGILSMFLTPLLVYKAPHFTAGERALDPLAKLLRSRSAEELEDRTVGHSDHVVVIGYGLAGRLLTNSLSRLKIEAVALEMNSDNVELGRKLGDPVYYADATSEEALGHAHVESCRAIVIMINDNQAIERVISTIARMKVEAPVFVRTQYMRGSEKLQNELPVNIVASEVEGGLEILSLVLNQLQIPRNLIIREVDQAREETMHSDREYSSSPLPLEAHAGLKDLKVEKLIVTAKSRVAGQSPRNLDLAESTGVSILAVRRQDSLLVHRIADIIFEPEDLVYCLGSKQDMQVVTPWFDADTVVQKPDAHG